MRGSKRLKLLIVIALISLPAIGIAVVGVSKPVVKKTEVHLRPVTSLSNFKAVGTAMSVYCSDYDGTLPPSATLKAPQPRKTIATRHGR